MSGADLLRRKSFRGAALMAVFVMILLTAPPSASAHDVLVSSNPVAGSLLDIGPSAVVLTFDQEVNPKYAHVAVTVAEGAPVAMSPEVDGMTVTTEVLPDLPVAAESSAAVWQIGYRVVSSDGHPIAGSITFTVGTGAEAEALATQAVRSDPVSATGEMPWLLLGTGSAALVAMVGAAVWRRSRRTDPGNTAN